jgi:predicted small lipoprotein YifL
VRRTTILSLVALAVVSASLSGCGSPKATPATTPPSTSAAVPQQPVQPEKNPPGDIPDNQAFVTFTTAGGFSIKVPEGWARHVGPSSVEFTDKLNTVRVAWSATSIAPDITSVAAQDIPALAKSEAAFKLNSIKTVTLPAGRAVLMDYRVNSAANAVTGKEYRLDVLRYTLYRAGKRVDLTLLSPVGADNVDPWRIVSRSLTWK